MKEPKSQYIRVLDVLVIGPLMIYGGLHLSRDKSQRLTALGLTFFGVTTIGYNLMNYFEIQRRGKHISHGKIH